MNQQCAKSPSQSQEKPHGKVNSSQFESFIDFCVNSPSFKVKTLFNRIRSNWCNKFTYKSRLQVAREEGFSEKSAQRHDLSLEDMGYIRIIRRHWCKIQSKWMSNIVIVDPHIMDPEFIIRAAKILPLTLAGIFFLYLPVDYEKKNNPHPEFYEYLKGCPSNRDISDLTPTLALCNSSGEPPPSSRFGVVPRKKGRDLVSFREQAPWSSVFPEGVALKEAGLVHNNNLISQSTFEERDKIF